MRLRLAIVLLVLAVFAPACKANQDARDLRNDVGASVNQSRTYRIRVASADAAYIIDAKVEDDLRYGLELLDPNERPLLDYVVRDDALAVRIRDQSFGAKLATSLGDPVVDKQLRSGRWVVDPSGAPPLIQGATQVTGETSGNPLQDARGTLQFIATAMDQARTVRRFSLDDIEYRSKLDPWRYPSDSSGEIRYDLLRPGLPHSEAATIRGASGDVGPANFRKLSIFVSKRRVEEMCEYVDILGHEDYLALQQRGLKSNPFLATLFHRVLTGDTAVPIRTRYVVVTIEYPGSAAVDVPAGASAGKLTTFNSALQRAVAAGVLHPAGPVPTSECVRKGSPPPTITA